MRMIDVEAAATKCHSSTGPSASESTPAGPTESTGATESSTLLAYVIDTLLEFVSAHPVERIRGVSRNCDRLGSAVRIDSGDGHARRDDIGDGATHCILTSHALQH